MFEYTFTKKVNAGTGIYKDGKEVKARKEVGKLPVMIPDFQDILSAVTAENADVLKRTEKGEPIANVFVSPEVQYIFDSVMEKTKARFAEFVTDDGSLSPKYVPWATLLDLSDPSFAKNIAEEFAALVKTHILSLGKSEALAVKISAMGEGRLRGTLQISKSQAIQSLQSARVARPRLDRRGRPSPRQASKS